MRLASLILAVLMTAIATSAQVPAAQTAPAPDTKEQFDKDVKVLAAKVDSYKVRVKIHNDYIINVQVPTMAAYKAAIDKHNENRCHTTEGSSACDAYNAEATALNNQRAGLEAEATRLDEEQAKLETEKADLSKQYEALLEREKKWYPEEKGTKDTPKA
jgi:chromosome segregation ATPase